MNKYASSAAKGALIGAIIVFIINWLMARIALVLGVMLALVFAAYVLQPLWNDDINTSEMRAIVDRQRVISYETIDGNVFYALENPTRFLLKNTKLTCGNTTVDLGSVGPGAEYAPIEGFTSTKAACDITYDPVEVSKHRAANQIETTVTRSED